MGRVLQHMRAIRSTAVQIRSARTEDLARLCEFAGELLLKWDAQTTGRDAERVYRHILAHPELGIILVAEHTEGLCGFAYGTFEWRAEFGGETMDLVELFVESSWRNRGVGRTLLDSLISQARTRNISHFTCQVHPGNSAVERVLESSGFDPQRRTVWGLRL